MANKLTFAAPLDLRRTPGALGMVVTRRSLGRRRTLRLRRGCGVAARQPQCFAHFGIQLGISVAVVLQELPRILAALPDALALIAEPRTRSSPAMFWATARSSRSPSREMPSP